MKRILCAAALAAALTFTGGGVVLGHTLTVENNGAGLVHDGKDLAKGITPDHPKKDGSAASQGTNVACEAVPEGGTVTITAGSGPCSDNG